VTKNEFCLSLALLWETVPEGQLSFDSIKALRRAFEETAYQASLQAPCEHPEGEIINGRCFNCGRPATRASVLD